MNYHFKKTLRVDQQNPPLIHVRGLLILTREPKFLDILRAENGGTTKATWTLLSGISV